MGIRFASSHAEACRMLNDAHNKPRKARRLIETEARLGVKKPDRELLWRAEAAVEMAREECERNTAPRRPNRPRERHINVFGGDE